MKQHILQGYIQEEQAGQGAALYIGDTIISEYFYYEIDEGQVSVSFYISDEEKTLDDFKENQILSLSGSVYARYGDSYSDYTGYLWTNDICEIGGHSLIEDLYEHEGKYCILIINHHE